MNKLNVALQHCYGIKKLEHSFDFGSRSAYVIYAPNGSMKSSFAQTFRDLSNNVDSSDRIFHSRQTTRDIVDEHGVSVTSDCVLVIQPYDEYFGHNEKTSTLLVNNELRQEYERIHKEINELRSKFIAELATESGVQRRDIPEILCETFTNRSDEEAFYLALQTANLQIDDHIDSPLAEIKYKQIFEDRIQSEIKKTEFQSAIETYIDRYNELLDQSTYFRKGVFEYYDAGQIAKTLIKHGFFKANHSISLNADTSLEIRTEDELERIIENEWSGITHDTDLRKNLDAITSSLDATAGLREFRQFLVNNTFVVPKLTNIDGLREEIWLSYFNLHRQLFEDLLLKFEEVKNRKEIIENQARKEQTLWEQSIEEFNQRFHVPFKLVARNKIDVALGNEQILDLQYTFTEETGENATVARDELLKVLSQGEKKALYILNIIFEIQVRMKENQSTIFVIDDIADSFDYINKYAIIQYLMELNNEPNFKQIILTHNFDFYRTVFSRFVGYGGSLIAMKDESQVSIEQASDIRNPFVIDWKPNFFKSGRKRIASIPFMRNLIEYTRGEEDPDYVLLTSLLHWKVDTYGITHSNLDRVYYSIFGDSDQSSGKKGHEPVYQLIEQEADDCMNFDETMALEQKIILSIAVRLLAERYMVNKLGTEVLQNIQRNQLVKLVEYYKAQFPNDVDVHSILNQVMLMTPENIHVNAFMYEPILDMSAKSLKQLYRAIRELEI